MGEGSPRRRKALLALLPLAVIGLLYAATPHRAAGGPARAGPGAGALPRRRRRRPSRRRPRRRRSGGAGGGRRRRRGSTWCGSSRTGRRRWSGTAEPGAKVTIYADEAPLAEAEADAEGNFVAIFKVEPSAEPRALTLGRGDAGGRRRRLGGGGDAAAAGAGRAGGRAAPPASRRPAAGGAGRRRATRPRRPSRRRAAPAPEAARQPSAAPRRRRWRRRRSCGATASR